MENNDKPITPLAKGISDVQQSAADLKKHMAEVLSATRSFQDKFWYMQWYAARPNDAYLLVSGLLAVITVATLLKFHGPDDFKIRLWGLMLQFMGIAAVLIDINLKWRQTLAELHAMWKQDMTTDFKPFASLEQAAMVVNEKEYKMRQLFFMAMMPNVLLQFGAFWLLIGVALSTMAPEIANFVIHN